MGTSRGGAQTRRRGSREPGPDGPTPGSGADDAPDADPESVARGIVLRKLTASAKTRAQLEETLASRGVPDEVAERVLDRFTEVGLVDDAAYADTYVRSRHAERGLSKRALAVELRRKGVADDTAHEALEQIDPDDERATAEALVRRRLAATRGLSTEARVRRLAGMLARKGYSSGLALAVVRDALRAEPATEPGSPADLSGLVGGAAEVAGLD